MDVESAHCVIGGVGAAWGAAELVGAARGTAEVGEAADDGAIRGWVAGPPASVSGAV
jgi:hypothetical protein